MWWLGLVLGCTEQTADPARGQVPPPYLTMAPVWERKVLPTQAVRLPTPGADALLGVVDRHLVEVSLHPSFTTRTLADLGPQTPAGLHDFDGDGVDEVVVGWGPDIAYLDVATGAAVHSIASHGFEVRRVGDFDDDGLDELLLQSSNFLEVRTPAGVLLASAVGPNVDWRVGEFDGTAGPEMIFPNGRILDLPSLSVYGDAHLRGTPVAAVDVDGDGVDAVVTQRGAVFELWDRGGSRWQWPTGRVGRTGHGATPVDLEGDGLDEVLVPSGRGYAVVDGLTGAERLYFEGVEELACRTFLHADLDDDGVDEVFCEEMGLYLDLETGQVVDPEPVPWPAHRVVADLDGDGDTELLGFKGDVVFVLEAEPTPELVYVGADPGWISTSMGVADLDGDGADELVSGVDGLHAFSWTGSGFTPGFSLPSTTTVEQVRGVDVDGDGRDELSSTAGVTDFRAGLLHGRSGLVVDVEQDGREELYSSGQLYDGETGVLLASFPFGSTPFALPNHTVFLAPTPTTAVEVYRFVRSTQTVELVHTFTLPGATLAVAPQVRGGDVIWHFGGGHVLGYRPP
jgi:hypothetical protein